MVQLFYILQKGGMQNGTQTEQLWFKKTQQGHSRSSPGQVALWLAQPGTAGKTAEKSNKKGK